MALPGRHKGEYRSALHEGTPVNSAFIPQRLRLLLFPLAWLALQAQLPLLGLMSLSWNLVALALPLLRPNGVLLASANTARLEPAAFIGQVHAAILKSGRGVVQEHYVPQPPDFPVSRDEPGHLKTLWLRISGAG